MSGVQRKSESIDFKTAENLSREQSTKTDYGHEQLRTVYINHALH